MPRALILLAHGSRDAAWSRPLHELAARVAALDPKLMLRIAYLEIQAPHLAAAIDELAQQVDDISVLPVFWAAGGHVARDLPRLLDEARERHPTLRLHCLPPLAELPGMLAFVATQAAALAARSDQAEEPPDSGESATRRTATATSIP